MPVYVYRVIRNDPQPAPEQTFPEETFEVRQSIHDAPLTTHPETGEPVERVLFPPMINHVAGNSEIASAGFTKYQRTADGTYERKAGGGGPTHLNPHDS